MMEWNEVLEKAEKRLSDSLECLRRFGEESDRQNVEEDRRKVEHIKRQMAEVIKFMDDHNIK